jgi:hypothetical protein
MRSIYGLAIIEVSRAFIAVCLSSLFILLMLNKTVQILMKISMPSYAERKSLHYFHRQKDGAYKVLNILESNSVSDIVL